MVICYLALGSNLGDRKKNILAALAKISRLKETKVLEVSCLLENKAVGGTPGQGDYLNAALKIKTNIKPQALLKKLKIIERELGRPKNYRRFAARPIDLDILFYGDLIIATKDLSVPHPRLFERDFVLKPLSEIL